MQNNKPLPGVQIDFSHPLARGLVGCWLMNEGGQRCYDLSPYKNHGTLSGFDSPPKRGSYGITFDGVNDYILSNVSDIDLSTFTISALIYPLSSGTTQSIVSHGSSPTDNGWSIEKFDGNIRLTLHGVGNYDSNSNILTLSAWQAITITLKENIVSFFRNNIAEGTASTSNIIVGTHKYGIGATPGNQNNFNGTIGEVYVWNRALSVDERKEFYINPYDIFVDKVGSK